MAVRVFPVARFNDYIPNLYQTGADSTLTVSPIGIIRTPMLHKFDAPHQPSRDGDSTSIISLFPERNYEHALLDLQGFDHIWLVWWFHRNTTWKPKVLPPRGKIRKRGVFATRSPHRPNPIGLSVVPLRSICGLDITIGACDLVDGTPILDIKPYLANVDSYPEATLGWVGEVEDELKTKDFEIAIGELAADQIAWLKEHEVNFIDRALLILQRDPSENRTRRIKRHNENLFRMGCGGWRVFFSVKDETVLIENIQSGYPAELLDDEKYLDVPQREAQLGFSEKWPRR